MDIIIHGKFYKGKWAILNSWGITYVFGHEVLCQWGKKGCLGTEVSGADFLRIVKERLCKVESSVLSGVPVDELTLGILVDALQCEGPLCIDIIEQMDYAIGGTLACLINIFNSELVIIGGIHTNGMAMPLSEELSRTYGILPLRKMRSKACCEKSADAIVVQQSVTLHEGLNLIIIR